MERGQVHERAPKASPDAVSWHISVWAGTFVYGTGRHRFIALIH